MQGSVKSVGFSFGVVTPQPVWHGTREEAVELTNAIAGNCCCEFDLTTGARVSTCAAHAMIEDQRLLDGLAFGRYLAKRLLEGEFRVNEHATAD
jgi:hypothetical protein